MVSPHTQQQLTQRSVSAVTLKSTPVMAMGGGCQLVLSSPRTLHYPYPMPPTHTHTQAHPTPPPPPPPTTLLLPIKHLAGSPEVRIVSSFIMVCTAFIVYVLLVCVCCSPNSLSYVCLCCFSLLCLCPLFLFLVGCLRA